MATGRLKPASAAAIIVTGGQSQRMGTDKASLVVDGVALLDRVRAVLEAVGIERIVVADAEALPDAGDADPLNRQGPMAGVVAGWQHLQRDTASADPIVVLSCDLPALQVDVIEQLIAAAPEYQHGVVAHDGERPQPLVAAYRPLALDALANAFVDGERSIRRCFGSWNLGTMSFDPEVLRDADKPEDLDGFDVQWPSS